MMMSWFQKLLIGYLIPNWRLTCGFILRSHLELSDFWFDKMRKLQEISQDIRMRIGSSTILVQFWEQFSGDLTPFAPSSLLEPMPPHLGGIAGETESQSTVKCPDMG